MLIGRLLEVAGSNAQVSVESEGLKELQNKMKELSKKETTAIFRKGARDGANVVKKYADNARGKKALDVSVRVWPDRAEAKVKPKKKYWYDKFRENGTKDHGPRKKGRKYMKFRKTPVGVVARHVSGVRARPFLRPALVNHQTEIMDAIAAGYKKKLDSLMEKKNG